MYPQTDLLGILKTLFRVLPSGGGGSLFDFHLNSVNQTSHHVEAKSRGTYHRLCVSSPPGDHRWG